MDPRGQPPWRAFVPSITVQFLPCNWQGPCFQGPKDAVCGRGVLRAVIALKRRRQQVRTGVIRSYFRSILEFKG